MVASKDKSARLNGAWTLDDRPLIGCCNLVSPFPFIVLIFVVTAPSLAASKTMNFERAMAILAASCGTDIDNNCRGVNLDPARLKECLRRNRISLKCHDDYPRVFSALDERVSARTTLSKLCNWEMNHLCGQVRQDPIKGLQCLLESSKTATPNCNNAIDATGYR